MMNIFITLVNVSKFLSVFTARRYASAVSAVVVFLSIRPSVCLAIAGIVSKWFM